MFIINMNLNLFSKVNLLTIYPLKPAPMNPPKHTEIIPIRLLLFISKSLNIYPRLTETYILNIVITI